MAQSDDLIDVPKATIRFTTFGSLGEGEIAALKQLAGPLQHFPRGACIRREGDPSPKMYFLIEGWTASSMLLPNGERQAIKVHMPGDLLGMPGLALAKAPDSLETLTPVTVSMIEPQALGHVFRTHPRIAAMLFLVSQEERVYLMDRLASIGRTQAVNRVAALLVNLEARSARCNGCAEDTFHAPLTQIDIGDLTGLTPVHVSRTLALLAKHKVCTWTKSTVTIIDRAKLRKLAGLPKRDLAKPDWLNVAA